MDKQKASILIVDDDSAVVGSARMFLKQKFTNIQALTNPGLIPDLFSDHDFDVVMLDMNFQKGETNGSQGFKWLDWIKRRNPATQVICMTAYGEIDIAVRTIKIGAIDFVIKPWENEKLYATILSALKLRDSRLEIDRLKSTQKELVKGINSHGEHIIGRSIAMQKILETAEKVAQTDANIMLLGENGTGKEVLAKMIHNRSHRHERSFIRVDLGALQENLFESELFGHVKGAFTDARDDKIGRFELARQGTLLLDEIGNLPMTLQAKLLTALQSNQIQKVGSSEIVETDVRLISATNMPLYDMVSKATFRQDLLYRINTVEIVIPPLRHRQEDIPLLLDHFLSIYCRKYDRPQMKIQKSDMKKLQKYHWPGNIRELQHAVERMVIMSEDNELDLMSILAPNRNRIKSDQEENFNLMENEKTLILRALEKNNGNVTQTAKDLGIDRLALYRRFNKFGI